MKLHATVFLLTLSVLTSSAWGQTPQTLGEEFQINSYTTGPQSNPSVAADVQGSFVVVWDSYGSSGTDTSYLSIQGQRYDASGAPVGSQFEVNSYTTNYQWGPSVAADAKGNFVVAWTSYRSDTDTSYESVQAQRYDASGAPVGGQFEVNSYTTDYQNRPAVATDPQGNFVVVWESDGSSGSDSSGRSIQGQRFAADGSTLGQEFQANSYTTMAQMMPAMAVGPAGDFVVVWSSGGSYGTDASYYSIQGRRFAANGAPLGSDFQVNTYTIASQWWPDVAVGPSGDFVVVWNSLRSGGADTSGYSIQGRRFSADGSPKGGDFEVNTYTTGSQRSPSVAISPSGDFVVVWNSPGSSGTDNSSISIQGQRYDTSGAPVGGEFQVNSYTTNSQWSPAVASDAQGIFVVIWGSDGSYGDDTIDSSIQGQRFVVPIFTDGFESGDTSAWSSTNP